MRLAALVFLILFCGCMGRTVVEERFVCADGWVVDEYDKCDVRERVCPPCPNSTYYVYINMSGGANVTLEAEDPCAMLGCPLGTEYAASANSRLYHTCGCHFARRIAENNLVCYSSESEAMQDGRESSGC
jgi:hypothetical protein